MNVNSNHKGRGIVSMETRTRRLSQDFPGWGAPDYREHLLPIPAGLTGVVTTVESHGSNPWTRYTVMFDDGTRASGLCLGTDFTWDRRPPA